MPELLIEHGSSAELIKDAQQVRRAVFIEGQDVPEERELDGLDSQAEHYVGYVDDEPVAVARTRRTNVNREIYGSYDLKIERVGVLPAYRGHGLGPQVMGFILGQMRDRPQVREAVLESQTHAVDFYKALGFTVFGNEFLDAGIPHRKMGKRLHALEF